MIVVKWAEDGDYLCGFTDLRIAVWSKKQRCGRRFSDRSSAIQWIEARLGHPLSEGKWHGRLRFVRLVPKKCEGTK